MTTTTPEPTVDDAKQLELELKRADLKLKKWDLVFKLGGLLALVFGIAWPLFQYTNTLEKEREDREKRVVVEQQQREKELDAVLREARKPFLERQLALYFEATTVASRISTLTTGPEREKARKRFYELYHGELSIVEDEPVARAMVDFKKTLELHDIQEATDSDMQVASLMLAHACRDSLARGWGYDRSASTPAKSTDPPPPAK
jgi:hypothetical protein